MIVERFIEAGEWTNIVAETAMQAVDILAGVIRTILTSSLFISILTAVVTVLLTFRFYRIRDKITGLRAVKSEVAYNATQSEQIDSFLTEDETLREQGKEPVESINTFQVSAFENLKNSGVLLQFSPGMKRSLEDHYARIYQVNQQIQQRERLRTGAKGLSNYNEILIQSNDVIKDQIEQLDFEAFDDLIRQELGQTPLFTRFL